MTRDGIFETVARAICCPDGNCVHRPDPRYSTKLPCGAVFAHGGQASAALSALEAAGMVVVPDKLLREAYACMRETGWHQASDHQKSDDGVIEAAVTEIEKQFAAIIKARPK